jgi:hypothetical protein
MLLLTSNSVVWKAESRFFVLGRKIMAVSHLVDGGDYPGKDTEKDALRLAFWFCAP